MTPVVQLQFASTLTNAPPNILIPLPFFSMFPRFAGLQSYDGSNHFKDVKLIRWTRKIVTYDFELKMIVFIEILKISEII